ncbi:MAG: SAM-dependent methyltransferase, partial [Pseudomonadota bacterium]
MDLDHLDTPQQGTTRTDWALRLIGRALKDIDTGQITLIGPSGNRVTLRGHKAGVEAVWHFRRPWRAILR